jgi:hypothetical protein
MEARGSVRIIGTRGPRTPPSKDILHLPYIYTLYAILLGGVISQSRFLPPSQQATTTRYTIDAFSLHIYANHIQVLINEIECRS